MGSHREIGNRHGRLLGRLQALAGGEEYPPGWERGQADTEAIVSFKKRSLRSSTPTW
jgi:hypothetical protein